MLVGPSEPHARVVADRSFSISSELFTGIGDLLLCIALLALLVKAAKVIEIVGGGFRQVDGR